MSSPSEPREKLKREYGSFYEDLIQLLAENDPMYLIEGGAPNDEYEPEVDAILLRLPEASSPTALGRIIYETFVKSFATTPDPPIPQPSERERVRFAVLGEKAWTNWTRWKEEVEPE